MTHRWQNEETRAELISKKLEDARMFFGRVGKRPSDRRGFRKRDKTHRPLLPLQYTPNSQLESTHTSQMHPHVCTTIYIFPNYYDYGGNRKCLYYETSSNESPTPSSIVRLAPKTTLPSPSSVLRLLYDLGEESSKLGDFLDLLNCTDERTKTVTFRPGIDERTKTVRRPQTTVTIM